MRLAKIMACICLITVPSIASAGLFGPDANKMTEDELYAWESKHDYDPTEAWLIGESARYAQIYAYLYKKASQGEASAFRPTTIVDGSRGSSSGLADAGTAVAVGSALDIASGKLGMGMINSSGINSGMFVLGLVGALLGSEDKMLEVKREYNSVTSVRKLIRLVRFGSSTSLPSTGIQDATIKNAFSDGLQLLHSSLDLNCTSWISGSVSTKGVMHKRTYSCAKTSVMLTTQIIGAGNSLSKEEGMLGRVVTTVSIGNADISQIRDKIPEGWYAVYPAEKDDKKVVLVTSRDRELAFDPPLDPFTPSPTKTSGL
jgi:hypothetical protein